MKYILVTLLYFILIVLFFQVLIYNVTIVNITYTFYSILWLLLIIYVTSIILINCKEIKYTNLHKFKYLRLLRIIFLILILSSLFLIIEYLLIFKELNLFIYTKFIFSFFIISVFLSLIYFLEVGFRKYRILWIISFVGTIVAAPLLVEAEMFVRDLRLRSLLDFWNFIVPYKSIEQLRNFVLLEGWQGWDVALASSFLLMAYWFIVASICLYVRQFQTNWELPEAR